MEGKDLEVMIGLEIHVQLASQSKIFCECQANYRESEPNSNVCPICTGQPGSKPMGLNKTALENLLKIASALNAKIKTSEKIYVQRKHYFYPDLPSGYQRTSKPIATEGRIGKVRIREVHIEEDPGRYELKKGLVDYNRSGVPLAEIVTEPDLKTPEEARAFLEELEAILGYLNAVREEAGGTRIDANISLKGGNRVEVKNINSFKGVYTALKYETVRQHSLLEKGGKITQETRHYDEAGGITIGMRKKETAEDYRYIPDPDIPPLEIKQEQVEKVKKQIPELPREKTARVSKEYEIKEEDAWVLASEKELVDLFENLANEFDAQPLANWMRGPLKKQLNYRNMQFKDSKLTTEHVEELYGMITKKEATDKTADTLLIKMLENPQQKPRALANKLGLVRIDNEKAIERIVEETLAENLKAIEDYKKGEQKALHYLAGKIMAKTRGTAAPEIVQKLLKEKMA